MAIQFRKTPKYFNRSSAFEPEDIAFLTALQTVCITKTLRAFRASGLTPEQMQSKRDAITETLNGLMKTIHDGVEKIMRGDQE